MKAITYTTTYAFTHFTAKNRSSITVFARPVIMDVKKSAIDF